MKNNIVKVIITGITSFLSAKLGVLYVPFGLLLGSNIIDYFTGLAASKVNGQKITSDKSFIGIVKKVMMYILIFVGFGIDCMISYVAVTLHIEMKFPMLFAAMVASWLVINELISITENCQSAGVTIPILSPVLKIIKKEIESVADMPKDEQQEK